MAEQICRLGMDHFIFERRWEGGGGGWAIAKKNSCTAKLGEKNHAQLAKGKKKLCKPFNP